MTDLVINIATGYKRLWRWANAHPQAFFLSIGLIMLGFFGRWLIWGAAIVCMVGGFRAWLKLAGIIKHTTEA